MAGGIGQLNDEDLRTGPIDWNARANGTNTTVTATQAAPESDEFHIVEGITISASGTPATTVVVEVIEDVAGTPVVMYDVQLPNAAFAPIDINFKKALRVSDGKSVSIKLPALGAGIVGRVGIRGLTRN